jgi:hypothetical protein
MATVDVAPDELGAVPEETPQGKDALSGVDRVITLDDLNYLGVQKLVLDRLDRAERAAVRLERLQSEFAQARIELAIAKAEVERLLDVDTMRSTLLGVGCLFVGLVPSIIDKPVLASFVAVGGIAMIVVSHNAKGRKQKA